MAYVIAANPSVLPWIIPAVGGGAGPVINSVTLSDNSITTREYTVLDVETEDTALVTSAIINSEYFALDLISSEGGVKTWRATIFGAQVGVVDGGTVTIYSSTNTDTSTDTSETITVTAASGYASEIWGALQAIQNLMKNPGVAYTYLNAVDDGDITIGERLRDYDYPLVHIEPSIDDLNDYTSGNRILSQFKARICAETKDPDSTVGLVDLKNLVGDIMDVLHANKNRTLSGVCRLETPRMVDWAYIEDARDRKKKSSVLRWCYIEVDVELMYTGG